MVANTILRRLTSEWGRRRGHAGGTRARMSDVARAIRFGCSLQLPTVRVAASDLEQVKPGDVLRLDVGTNALSELRVAGQALSLAHAMRHGAHRAARIERVLAGGEP